MAIKTPVDTRLAIDGGTPVRSADDPLPGIFPVTCRKSPTTT